jgi:xylulokinase
MVEEEGAAVGGALQAAWCVALRNGNRKAKLASLTDRVVAVDENTRCRPDPKSVRQYQKLQSLQDELSLSLRSIFDKRRALLGA